MNKNSIEIKMKVIGNMQNYHFKNNEEGCEEETEISIFIKKINKKLKKKFGDEVFFAYDTEWEYHYRKLMIGNEPIKNASFSNGEFIDDERVVWDKDMFSFSSIDKQRKEKWKEKEFSYEIEFDLQDLIRIIEENKI